MGLDDNTFRKSLRREEVQGKVNIYILGGEGRPRAGDLEGKANEVGGEPSVLLLRANTVSQRGGAISWVMNY